MHLGLKTHINILLCFVILKTAILLLSFSTQATRNIWECFKIRNTLSLVCFSSALKLLDSKGEQGEWSMPKNKGGE